MTGLSERLARRICVGGPITVADYMIAALADPSGGYYRIADPIGAGGDFTTAPEISQIFGELIGAWLIDCWDQRGRPEAMNLVELGPGRGLLMRDALRVAGRVPGWRRAVALHLVEINPGFRQAQEARLGDHAPRWHESLSTVPEGPMLLVANEFLDAMPIRQLVFMAGHWRERLVGWHADAGFHFVLARTPSPLAMLLPAKLRSAGEGELVELSPASLGLAAEIGRRVATHGGAALIIDYGRSATATGQTLQAIARHQRAEVLATPGTVDISAHVDFDLLGRSAREAGASVFGAVSQGNFLRALGIEQRANVLKAQAEREAIRAIDDSVERLTGDSAMGELFKVMAIAGPNIVPAGFAPERAADADDVGGAKPSGYALDDDPSRDS